MVNVNSISVNELGQYVYSNMWIVLMSLLALIVLGYFIYLTTIYAKIQKCRKILLCEINSDNRNYNHISNVTSSLQTKLDKKLYVFKHENIQLLIAKATKITQFNIAIHNLQEYIRSQDNYSANRIIYVYKNICDDYLEDERNIFARLLEQYYEQEELLKNQFIAEVDRLLSITRCSMNLSLIEVRRIESSIEDIVCESRNIRYVDYGKDVEELKNNCVSLVKKVQEAERAKEHLRQQAALNAEIQTLVSNFSTAVKHKDIDNADEIQSKIYKTINKSNDQLLKDEFTAISDDYNKQKQDGVSVFEEECYVNYSYDYKTDNTYPIVSVPQKDCIVWPHRRRQIARRGYKELAFQNSILHYLSNVASVLGDVNLLPQSDCRPYEPDIAIVDLRSGYNLRIDVEIDEPYAGLSNKPTHYIGCGDDYRDANINRLGWIVVRFSEFQVHTQPLNCIAFICRIIKNIIHDASIDSKILQLPDPNKEQQWQQVDAQKWAKEKYRQQYLNHEFGFTESNEIYNKDTKLSSFEQSIKYKVKQLPKPTPFVSTLGGYNSTNAIPQDADLDFDDVNHIYSYCGIPFKAVSTIISEFFPVFDQPYWAERKAKEEGIPTRQKIEEWEDKGNFSREAGTFLHAQIENYYLKKPVTYIYNYVYKGKFVNREEQYSIKGKEFQYFLNFVHDRSVEPYRTEWRIYCKHLKVAGTIDFIAKNGANYDIYDWKRSDKLYEDNPFQNGLGGLSHLQDTRLNHYNIQQNLYKWILENEYGITIGNMYLVVLHHSYDNYRIIEVPRMDVEVQYIIDNL